MNALFVNNLFPPIAYGGYEILCAQVMSSLRRRGHHIDILTSRCRADEVEPVAGIRRELSLTTRFPRPDEDVGSVDFRLRSRHRVAQDNRRVTARVLQQKSYDLVFAWCLNRMSLGPLVAAKELGVPVAYTINDEHPKQFAPTAAARSLRQRLKALGERTLWRLGTFRATPGLPMTVISRALRSRLVAQGTPVGDAEVIYQGIPLGRFPYSPRHRSEGEPLRILYAGQLSRNKGVHTIARALGELRRQGGFHFEWTIAGAGVPSYCAELKSLIESVGIAQSTRWLGFVDQPKLAETYRKNHVLVFSTEIEEAFGLTHLEAMASGVAVISTTTGGCAELVLDGENALAYEAGSASSLSEKLLCFAKDESLRRDIAHRGRQYVAANHSLDGYVEQLESFMHRAIERGRH